MKIALLSTDRLPAFLGTDHPDEESLFAEDDVLARAFQARGAEAERIPWHRQEADWGRFDIALLRSTWDYIDDLPGFLAALTEIDESGCRLINPLPTIRWNCNKAYLAELTAAGLPVVPTVFCEPGADPVPLIEELGGSDPGYVVKPLVGVGGYGVERCRGAASAAAALGRLAAPALLQPYLPAIATEGEWSFVFGAGKLLYCALKIPKSGDYRVQVMYGAQTRARDPSPGDRALAERCLRSLPVTAEVARMDFVRLPGGRLALMEAELIEPQLYFHDIPDAADKLAQAVVLLAMG